MRSSAMPISTIMMQLTLLGKSCSGISQPRPANALTIQHVMIDGPGMHVLAARFAKMHGCMPTSATLGDMTSQQASQQ